MNFQLGTFTLFPWSSYSKEDYEAVYGKCYVHDLFFGFMWFQFRFRWATK